MFVRVVEINSVNSKDCLDTNSVLDLNFRHVLSKQNDYYVRKVCHPSLIYRSINHRPSKFYVTEFRSLFTVLIEKNRSSDPKESTLSSSLIQLSIFSKSFLHPVKICISNEFQPHLIIINRYLLGLQSKCKHSIGIGAYFMLNTIPLHQFSHDLVFCHITHSC